PCYTEKISISRAMQNLRHNKQQCPSKHGSANEPPYRTDTVDSLKRNEEYADMHFIDEHSIASRCKEDTSNTSFNRTIFTMNHVSRVNIMVYQGSHPQKSIHAGTDEQENRHENNGSGFIAENSGSPVIGSNLSSDCCRLPCFNPQHSLVFFHIPFQQALLSRCLCVHYRS
ncbi:hypothetical protein L9F63_003094, partial [Diploptera punctata]